MRLRTALNDYKRRLDEPFPGEAPTTTGAFSGFGDRLVYVERDGSFRDYSAELSGLHGVDRSRLGIDTGDGVLWFDHTEPIRQHYYRESALVETEYDAGEFSIHQYDLTLGRAHLTHVELRGEVPPDAQLVAFLTLAPEGKETQVSRLIHEAAGYNDERVVEVYHRREHDYVAASTPLEMAMGNRVERMGELLDDASIQYPRDRNEGKPDQEALTGDIVVTADLEQVGRAARTTLTTQLSDHDETSREQALIDVTHAARSHASVDDLRDAALERSIDEVPDDTPNEDAVTADLRALSLLTGPTGARLAAPEFDPFFEHTGGYGYTWFRDDSEISAALLDADSRLGLDLDDRLLDSAMLYCRTQLDDGTWPHRIWAVDERLAPGWANERLEGEGDGYQADQTAAVTTYLAELLRERENVLTAETRSKIVETIHDAVEGLDETLADNGLPERCQNAWEDMSGQFAHTTAKFLEAYATVADAPLEPRLREHAAAQADRVYGAVDELWSADREFYAMRLDDGTLDEVADSAALELAGAVRAYAEINPVDEATLTRLQSHVENVVDALYREAGDGVTGLIRYEGDRWRTNGQGHEKLWSVATALGTTAAAELGMLLQSEDEAAEEVLDLAGELYRSLESDGPFVTDAGYLAEQVFDDGRPDSAAPLGWTHAVRLRATAVLKDLGALPTPSAPEGPGERPTWTTGEKFGVGTVADHHADGSSKVWFTLAEGALTEVRYPRIDTMNLRTMDFLVVDTDEDSEYVARSHNETRTDDHSETIERSAQLVEEDALVFRHSIVETGDSHGHKWSLIVDYVTDPEHDALLAKVTFEADDDNTYDVFTVADTALTNTGDTDRGLLLGQPGDYSLAARDATAFDLHDEDPLLVDDDGEPFNVAVALSSASSFDWASAEVAGTDRIHGLFVDGEIPDSTNEVDEENVVLVGRIGSGQSLGETVALGFARESDTAGALGEADGALARGFSTVRDGYEDSWESFLADKELPASVAHDEELTAQYKASLMVLQACEDKTYHGAAIASPSVPWGEVVPADQQKAYGYNFVWSRDLYQTFTAFQAVGELETAQEALSYIYEYQQDEQGFIPQNTYLQGRTRWGGEQMDNISFPQVMAYHLAQEGIGFGDADYEYENVRRSSDYVVRNGPVTAQERWEEESGFSPSSLAAEIAGLTCAGSLATAQGNTADALVWHAVADAWVDEVEDWTATEEGTSGFDQTPYYCRITRHGDPDDGSRRALANGGPTLEERAIVDAGFLELVRLGIKPWDDETIRNSLSVVDDSIRVETPHGPAFYRYNGDGYGELEREREGAPWHPHEPDGRGRLWPIFTGERGEYELLAGATDEDAPERLLETMEGFANTGRMIPEQVWDIERPSDYNWEFGEGTGSATPLAWSMAQFVRLAHGIDNGEPIETPEVVRQRYLETERPDGPELWVDTNYEAGALVVTVETDGDLVAIKTPAETAVTEPTSGKFVVRLDVVPGENQVTVAAATSTDLETAGTTVDQFTL
ncbi:glycoside hydrolase family 15 protein [Haloarcula halophila]|uniref:glycoside hydrolase family 15 protein n=1 Tax=Haloarcula TaxID=2237 RepID=UPI0023E461D6|nr:glycoside hydrolase family 15 protein [Halomicroarcula sp. DFY41]